MVMLQSEGNNNNPKGLLVRGMGKQEHRCLWWVWGCSCNGCLNHFLKWSWWYLSFQAIPGYPIPSSTFLMTMIQGIKIISGGDINSLLVQHLSYMLKSDWNGGWIRCGTVLLSQQTRHGSMKCVRRGTGMCSGTSETGKWIGSSSPGLSNIPGMKTMMTSFWRPASPYTHYPWKLSILSHLLIISVPTYFKLNISYMIGFSKNYNKDQDL